MAQSVGESPLDVALAIVGRRKWIGIATLAGTLALALPFVLYLPDVYRGEATVIIENADAIPAFVHDSVPDVETRLITLQQELLSRSRLTALIHELNLYPRQRRHASMEALVQWLRRDIHVELSRADRGRSAAIGLKISYIGLDPRTSAAVPNTLARLYVDENTKIRERQTSQLAEFLKAQVDTSREAVDAQQARLNRFKEIRTGQLPEQVSINMVALERLQERLRLNLEDQAKLTENENHADEPADPLQTLKNQLAELQTKFTDKHPDVIRLKAQIAEAQQRQRSAQSSHTAQRTASPAAASQMASLRNEERTIRGEIASYQQRIQSTPRVEQELEALQRDYNLAKESYDSLLKRYEEAQLADNLEQTKKTESFRILDSAIVPVSPAAPNRNRLLLMAVFFAFASAVGVMLGAEHLDTSFHTVGEVRQFTTVPVLASIPFVPTRRTFGAMLRVAAVTVAVIGMCVLFAGFSYRTARENTQLVWMLSAPRV